MCATGGLAGARNWKSSRCVHLEGQQVRTRTPPTTPTTTTITTPDTCHQGFPQRFCHGGWVICPPLLHWEGDRWRVKQAYMELLQVHAPAGPLRVVIIELQLMLLWSHMKYHFGIICNFLQSFSVSSLSS